MVSSIDDVRELAVRVRKEVGKVIVGKADIINKLLVALLVGGHVLLEGVPGLAKTYMARAFSQSLGLKFKRIQLTPDLLPTDITGTRVYNPKTVDFELRYGPVFTNILLADEINRTPPRTQSALLEAMQEKQVTIDGETRKLPEPFMVIATQNPVETEGTYPLPEAQLDRFLFRLIVDYPNLEEEVEILKRKHVKGEIIDANKVADASEVLEAGKIISYKVRVEEDIMEYIVNIVRVSREHPAIMLGGSPRASVSLLYASKAYAAVTEGRDYVIPDDIKALAFDVLNHRLMLRPEYLVEAYSREKAWSYSTLKKIIKEVVERVEAPK